MRKVREEMNDTVTVTFTSEQYNWVRAVALDTFKDAGDWLYDTEDDGSEAYTRRAKYNTNIMAIAQQVLEMKARA